MQVPLTKISLYVKVECDAHSRHRDPKGVYHVEVNEEKTLVHTACAARQLIKDHVAFLHENEDKATISVFTHDGMEIRIPKTVDSEHHNCGSFKGRVFSFPETISFQ